jgi:translation initiation factor IF-2
VPDDDQEQQRQAAEEAAAKAAQDAADAKAATEKEDEPFDKDRALATIKKQRESEDAAKKRAADLEAKVKQYEDASKSEQEKLDERASGAESRASTAEADAARLRVALRKGLTETQAKRLVGDDEEALEKDADELLASFKTDDEPADTRRRPQERLRPGSVPNVAATTDMNDFIRAGSKRT